MKPSGAVATNAILILLAGLVGLVWFELPKGQRVDRSAKLRKLAPYELDTGARRSTLATRVEPVEPTTSATSGVEVVDLRSSTPTPMFDELEATLLATSDPDESAPAEFATEACDDELNSTIPSVTNTDGVASEPPTPEPSAALTLWMRDVNGAPISEGEVRARWREDGVSHERVARCDERGFTTFDAPLGDGVVLEARAPGFAPASFGPLERARCAGAELGVALERGARLLGVVRGASRDAALTVAVWPTGNQGLALNFECELDENARFELDGVWPGPLDALVFGADGAVSAVASTEGDSTELAFELEPGVSRIGTVREPLGRAVHGASVEAWAVHDGFAVARLAATRTDSKGHFELHGVASLGLVRVDTLEWAPCWAATDVDGPMQLTLSPRRTLRVRLTGVDTSTAEWSLSGWGVEDIASTAFTSTELVLEGLAPGPYSLALRGPDGATRHFTYTLASQGDGDLELRLR